MNILLDYFFPITAIEPTPAASTAFLKQVCVVAKPKSGQEGNVGTIYQCTTAAQVAARTDNTESTQLFNAGMAKVYVLLANDLYLESYLNGVADFYTLLISSDFSTADITETNATGVITVTSYANLLTTAADVVTIAGTAFTAQAGAATLGDATFQAATSNNATAASLAAQINAHAVVSLKVVATVLNAVVTLTAVDQYSVGNAVTLTYTDNGAGNIGITLSGLSSGKLSGGDGLSAGIFKGVIGVSSTDDSFLNTQAAIANRAAFHTTSGNKAKNLFYAFGKLLSNALDWLNQQYVTMPVADDVTTLGAAKTLFDDKISFVISDDQFSDRLALFAAGGKAIVGPYIKRNLQIDMQSAALSYVSGNQPSYTHKHAGLLEDELQKVVLSYIERGWIEKGTVEVKLEQDNFVASGYINIADPKALWIIEGEMKETL